MSLDVYLHSPEGVYTPRNGSGIFVRSNGSTREVTLDEWNAMHPDREPITVRYEDDYTDELYSANITHNLNDMAKAAGIYEVLWRPDEIGVNTAEQLIEPLRVGLAKLKKSPDAFRKLNPENGWGTYEGLVEFVENYVTACELYPYAVVSVSR